MERAVLQISMEGKVIKKWSSIKEAAEKLYLSSSAITACCKHYEKAKTAGGYKWEYVNKD